MTWQLAAFGILALALAAGFGWYERTKPDARIVALVATLAAFAALGRIAFAALPNVKPTTDIVLVSGYALGGGPGFAVGALGGLASNFFFGQGPWTPWQMAGWGMVGLIGACLAAATRRQVGRWPLALLCTVVGFAFTALQDVGDWVTYSDHSPAALGVYVGKGIGFDAVHAAGCLIFALALGPALVRSLRRFTARLQVTWQPAPPRAAPWPPAAQRPPAAPLLLLAGLVLSGWLASQPASMMGGLLDDPVASAQAAGTPAGYLRSAQNSDGGFGPAAGASSAQLYSGWAALGLAAAGQNPQDVVRGGRSLLGYIQAGVPSMSDSGSIERTILVARAAGVSPRAFGGRDLVAALERDIRPGGSVAAQVNLTAFAVLALRAAGVAPPSDMLRWLERQQDADGGFNFASRGGMSDPDDTGAALEALAGAGGNAARASARAVGYLRRQQDDDGGFAGLPGAGSNAQSTAFAVQGLIAAGVDPGSLRRRGVSPLDYLSGLIAADGHVRYARDADQTPTWVTGEALMALDGKALPLTAVARAPVTPAAPAHHASAPAGRHIAPSAPRRPAAPARRAVAARRRPLPPPAASGATNLDRLAEAAGILTALTLALVGQG